MSRGFTKWWWSTRPRWARWVGVFRDECAVSIRTPNGKEPSIGGFALRQPVMTRFAGEVLKGMPQVVVAAKAGVDQAHIELDQESGIVNFPDSGRCPFAAIAGHSRRSKGAHLSLGRLWWSATGPAVDVQEFRRSSSCGMAKK